jgi:hypothetical protein
MKIKLFKNGAYTTLEKQACGYYSVQVRSPSGELIDKIRCDTYRDACEYRRAFNAIARNS